jgi:hypothetical protein
MWAIIRGDISFLKICDERAHAMKLQNSLQRLGQVVSELEKIAAQPVAQTTATAPKKTAQIDLFAPKNLSADNTLVAMTLDRTIARIENLLQAGGR